MFRLLKLTLMNTLIGSILVTSSGILKAEEGQDASVLLDLARKAVGGKEKLAAIESLSANGKVRRIMGEMDQSGDLKLELLLPSRYKREETLSMPMGPEMTMTTALNGDQAWHDMRGPIGMPLMPPGMKDNNEKFKAMELREAQSEYLRQVLVLFLGTPDTPGLEFKAGGKAEAEDGRADIVDVKGTGDFAARLFLDEKTHLPLMLSYQGRIPQPRGMMPPPFTADRKMGPPSPPPDFNPAAMPVPATAEVQLMLGDYRAVNGLQLPFHFSQSSEGKVFEEWTIAKYKINPQLNPDRFKQN
jgi:hypothetical protein